MVAIGLGFLGIGAYALLSQVALNTLPNLFLWLVGGLFLHDAILAPIVAIIGFFLSKSLAEGTRHIVEGGLIVAGVISLIALPVVISGGKTESNPSLLPLDYSRNLLVALVIIGALTGLLVVLQLLRHRASTPPADVGDSERR
jgi:hypothetical protein